MPGQNRGMTTSLYSQVQNEKVFKIVKVISDHGREFENKYFEKHFHEHGTSHDFSRLRNP